MRHSYLYEHISEKNSFGMNRHLHHKTGWTQSPLNESVSAILSVAIVRNPIGQSKGNERVFFDLLPKAIRLLLPVSNSFIKPASMKRSGPNFCGCTSRVGSSRTIFHILLLKHSQTNLGMIKLKLD